MNAAGSGRWPTGTDYTEAIQQPSRVFADPELAQCTLTFTPLGLPAMASGQNAIAFHATTSSGQIAIRCLLSSHPGGGERYNALTQHLAAHPAEQVVASRWIEGGIRCNGQTWPVVVMPWVRGEQLHDAIESRAGEPDRLERLARTWFDLVLLLQSQGFAHGDLQHGNVLVTDCDEFRLIDLDGIWVPGISVSAPPENGHPNYQHPARSHVDWGPNVDTLSALIIGMSMLAAAADRSVVQLMTGENLTVTVHDLRNVDNTPTWERLRRIENQGVGRLVSMIATAAKQPVPANISLAAALATGTPAPQLNNASARLAPPVTALDQNRMVDAHSVAPADSSVSTAAAVGWWSAPAAVLAPTIASSNVANAAQSALPQPPSPAYRPLRHAVAPAAVGGALSGAAAWVIAASLKNSMTTTQTSWMFHLVGAIAMALVVTHQQVRSGGRVYRFRRLTAVGGVTVAAATLALLINRGLADSAVPSGFGEHDAFVVLWWAILGAMITSASGASASYRTAGIGFAIGGVTGGISGIIALASPTDLWAFVPLSLAQTAGGFPLAMLNFAVLGTGVALALYMSRTAEIIQVQPNKLRATLAHSDTLWIGGGARDLVAIPSQPGILKFDIGGGQLLVRSPTTVNGRLQAGTSAANHHQTIDLDDRRIVVTLPRQPVLIGASS